MVEIQAPNSTAGRTRRVFLAGSIEMGRADEWQKRFMDATKDMQYTALNPRRSDWDSTWKQSIDNPLFKEQVDWELDGIKEADLVVFYFDQATYSPITLMELGYVAARNWQSAIVCCPKEFWRKGNVDILCQREGITVVTTLEELISAFRTSVRTQWN